MTSAAKKILEDALSLPEEERAALVDALNESLEAPEDALSPEWRAEIARRIEAIAAEGLKVHVTELEVDVLPRPSANTGAEISAVEKYADKLNPYVDGLPKEVEQEQIDRYKRFFELLLEHRDKIERVTFWGMHDGESWKNNFPVRGRTNYPLLFDRKLNKKPVYDAVAALGRR